MKKVATHELLTARFEFKKKEGELAMLMIKPNGEIKASLRKQGAQQYAGLLVTDSAFVDMTKEIPLLTIKKIGRMDKPASEYADEYQKILEEHGMDVHLYTFDIALEHIPDEEYKNPLQAEKTYKANQVELVNDEEVLAFAKEHVNTDYIVKHHEYNQDQLEEMFLGNTYKIEVQGSGISMDIKGKSGAAKSKITTTLRKIEDGQYRADGFITHYDFFIDEESEDSFQVQRIDYVLLLPEEEELHSLKAFKKLQKNMMGIYLSTSYA